MSARVAVGRPHLPGVNAAWRPRVAGQRHRPSGRETPRKTCRASWWARPRAGRRGEIGIDFRIADDTIVPPHAGTHQKPVLPRQEFHDLAEFGLQSLRREARRPFKKLIQGRPLQREDAELGEDLLLTNAEPQCAAATLRRPGGFWTGFNDRVLSRGWRRHVSC